jgi:hypothetical protein
MPFRAPPLKPKKLLIITSSGGGGLLQTANAKEQEARAADPNIQIVRKDILEDWLGAVFGKWCSEAYNSAQRKGNLAAIRFFISSQYLLDFFAWPYFFLRALQTLFKEEADHIIDTQPIGTSAILKALRIYNWKRGKEVRLQKVLVDLPTKSATHFFRTIKTLSKKDRFCLQLTSIAPLLEEGQTAEDFWQKNCGLSEKEIHYEDYYVRQSFKKFQHKKRSLEENFSLFLRFKNEEELSLMKKAYERGPLSAKVLGNEVHFSIPPKERLITILLGSQPAGEATFNYVMHFLQLCKAEAPTTPCHIFVFCAGHESLSRCLFQKVASTVAGMKDYPRHVTVVPFSFQNDDCIAPLFFRSDLTCTRSGGQTAMELMCISSGEMWIHSETKKDPEQNGDLTLEQLLSGIPGWEAANALYLCKVRSARIVTPETIAPIAKHVFKTASAPEPREAIESLA